MARSKKAKQRAARQQAHQARAARHEDAARHKEHAHLPHTGTPEDEAYLLRRGREDLVGFGEFRRAKGPLPVIVAVVVGVLFALGVLAWVFSTW